MAYTGQDYFLQVKVQTQQGEANAKVRDYDIDNLLQTKGSILTSTGVSTTGQCNFTAITPGTNNDGKILTLNAGMPSWQDPGSVVTGAGNGPLNLKVGNNNPSVLFHANQATNTATTLTITAGSTNGYLTINDVALKVPGTDILQDTNMTSVTNLESKLVADGFAKTTDIKDGALNIQIGSGSATKLFSANTSTLATLTIAQGTTAGYLSFNGVGISVPGVALASNVPAAANDGKLRLSVNGTTTDFFSANSANAATLSFATGSANGTIKVGSTNVAVYGLKSAAYAETTAFDAAGAATTAANGALTSAKSYTDEKVAAAITTVMKVVGTGSSLPASGTNQGDVFIINSGADAGKEYVWTGSAWELLGQNSIDLSNYVPTSRQVAGISLTSNISASAISTALGLKALAFKASASTSVTDYATGVEVTGSGTDTTSISAVKASGASKVTDWNGGSAALEVENGVLRLNFTAATATINNAQESTITISHKTYSGTLTKGNKTITVS